MTEPTPDAAGFDREAWLASRSRKLTLASWDERAPAHFRSPGYDVAGLLADPAAISDVVRFDLPRLGDITGQRGVHLQCHIGTDTLSLHRLGATMTGVDYSQAAIAAARDLAQQAKATIQYHQCDLYDAPTVLGTGGYDLVFTGIGALCWLPRIDPWAHVVASLLRPGGRLFLREGHPMLWSLDDPTPQGQLVVEHAYFERPEPTVWNYPGTYVQTEVDFVHNETHEWNHGLAEIITALLDHGLAVVGLAEHDTVPWDALPGVTEPCGGGEYRLKDRPWRLPMSYTLQAVKR
jgi:2-polyprenyl-3-methyl-5-hydroxy-6-metoxy-1,4-benzoquinol methylase